jgi:hypothetical protein
MDLSLEIFSDADQDFSMGEIYKSYINFLIKRKTVSPNSVVLVPPPGSIAPGFIGQKQKENDKKKGKSSLKPLIMLSEMNHGPKSLLITNAF